MKLLYFSLALLLVLFHALIFWAFQEQSFSEGVSHITAKPWGLVTLADLYLGFFIFSIFIFLTQKSFLKSVLWCLALVCLGNGIALLYIMLIMKKHGSQWHQVFYSSKTI
jgi:hypothetical protein